MIQVVFKQKMIDIRKQNLTALEWLRREQQIVCL